MQISYQYCGDDKRLVSQRFRRVEVQRRGVHGQCVVGVPGANLPVREEEEDEEKRRMKKRGRKRCQNPDQSRKTKKSRCILEITSTV